MKNGMMPRRIGSAVVSAVMCVAMFTNPVFAVAEGVSDLNGDGVVNVFDIVLAKRETVIAAKPMIMDINEVEAMPGDTITLDIFLQDNPGFGSFSFMVQYDAAVLEPVYRDGALVYTYCQGLENPTATVLPCGLQGTLLCMAEPESTWCEDGTLLSIEFKVSQQAAANAQYGVTLFDTNFYDADGALISSILLEKGTVSIPAHAANGTENDRVPFSFGIDVSRWQGDIDWEKVKADERNVEFVMIRAGSGSGDPAVRIDPYFERHYAGATSVGLSVGAYWYSGALTPEAAVAEAETCLSILGDLPFQFPIAYDMELEAQWKMSPAEFSAIADAFCSTMEEAGYYVTVYSSATPLNQLFTEEMRIKYGVWVAQYAPDTIYNGDYGMWQYSCKGSIDGIDTDVDLNHCYYDYASIICGKGFNNCVPVTEEAA